MDYWRTKRTQIIAFVVCIATINKAVCTTFVCPNMGYYQDNTDRSCMSYYFCDLGDTEVEAKTCNEGQRFSTVDLTCKAKDTVICPTDGPVPDNFYVRVYNNKDQRYNGNILSGPLKAKSKIECSIHCLNTINCKGFNYKYIKSAQGNDCEILSDKSSSLSDLTHSPGFVYYEMLL